MEKYFRIASGISRWKIDSFWERFLARIADNSEMGKRFYIFYYSIFDSSYHKNGREYIRKEIDRQKDNFDNFSKLSDSWLMRDMEYSLHRYGVSFEEYFIYRFYDLNKYGRRKFNSLKMQYGYCEQFNTSSIGDICEDKYATYCLFKEFYKRKLIIVDSIDIDCSKIESFIQECKKMFFKPLRGHSGQGVKMLQAHNITRDTLNGLYEKFGPYILEELINQGKEMSELHPSSINTVRCATVKTSKGCEIFGCALRMGKGGSSVDNAGAGGLYATVDFNYGIVVSKAIDNIGNEYLSHPDTKVIIPGFKLPDWNNAKQMVEELASIIPEAGLIAWDLAYDEKGWCLVEANDIGEQYLFQGPIGRGIKPKLLSLLDFSKKLN